VHPQDTQPGIAVLFLHWGLKRRPRPLRRLRPGYVEGRPLRDLRRHRPDRILGHSITTFRILLLSASRPWADSDRSRSCPNLESEHPARARRLRSLGVGQSFGPRHRPAAAWCGGTCRASSLPHAAVIPANNVLILLGHVLLRGTGSDYPCGVEMPSMFRIHSGNGQCQHAADNAILFWDDRRSP